MISLISSQNRLFGGTSINNDEIWRKTMRAFIAACFAVALIAVSAAAFLDHFAQESSATAFAEPSARI
jgi:hypothetical protein